MRVRNTTPFEAATGFQPRRCLAEFAGLNPYRSWRAGWHDLSLCLPLRSRSCELAASCKNIGTWPVLVGEEGQRDTLLSSPIILYDYPQIAPESAGDLFDGTEIDEILSLRIMTLTDDEKREMSQSDERARQMLERTETMPVEQLMKLHGVLRGLRPLKEEAPMNEWEWQLLEEKTPVDHLEISGSRSAHREPRAPASAQGRRRDGHRAGRPDRDHRMHRAGLRGQAPRLRGSGSTIRDGIWACFASPAIASFLTRRKSSRLSEEEARQMTAVAEAAHSGRRHRQHLSRRRCVWRRSGPPHGRPQSSRKRARI